MTFNKQNLKIVSEIFIFDILKALYHVFSNLQLVKFFFTGKPAQLAWRDIDDLLGSVLSVGLNGRWFEGRLV